MLLNPESETMLLSAFLKFPRRTGSVCVEKAVSSDTFHSQENGQLYKYLLGVWAEDKPIEPHMITFGLKKAGLLSVVGGIERLQQMAILCPSAELVEELVKELKDLEHRRRLSGACKSVFESLQGNDETPALTSQLSQAIEGGGAELNIETPTPHDLNLAVIDQSENANVIQTGFRAIDDGCGSLYAGDFLVVAGGAKAGKSALAGNIASNIARSKFVAIFTLEMNRVEFWKRIINAASRVTSNYWHPNAPILQSDQTRVLGSMKALENSKITIVDKIYCIEQAFAMCRALKSKHGELGAVLIDYLQLFSSPEKVNTRAEQVAHISRACKRAAVSLDTLVIGVSQLNDDGKSLDSRGIQRDANLMLNVLVDDDGDRNVLCAYNRNGPMGHTLPLHAELQFNRFIDAD